MANQNKSRSQPVLPAKRKYASRQSLPFQAWMIQKKRKQRNEVIDKLKALINSLFSANEQGAFYAPKPIVNGTQALFQGAAGTVPVTADGDPVGRMVDQSPNSNNAAQSVSSQRPVYQTDGTLHWLLPDGVGDNLNVGLALDHEEFTLVTSYRAGNDNQRVFDNRGTGLPGDAKGWHIKARHDAGDIVTFDDGAGNAVQWSEDDPSTTSPGLDEYVVITIAYQSGQAIYRINGVDQGAPGIITGGGLAAMGSIVTGIDGLLFTARNVIGTQSFDGRFYGGVLVNKYLGTSDIENTESYFASLAGVTL